MIRPRQVDRYSGTVMLVALSATLMLAAAMKHGGIASIPTVLGSLVRQPPPRDVDRETFLGLVADGHRIGPEDAPITILVFGTYACGYCAELDATLDSLMTSYPTQLSIVHRSFVPGAPGNVLRAHMAAECAALQRTFPAYHAAMFRNRNRLGSRTAWLEIADQAGLPDIATFRECVITKREMRQLVHDTETGKRLGVAGTPTSFINGRRMIGAWSVASIEELIMEELAGSNMAAEK